jgi:riboflavin kinase/FMN adenylyltransferase
MAVFNDIAAYSGTRPTAVTIGSFDGFHLGHRQIIKTLQTVANTKDLQPVVVTFNPHPQEVLRPKNGKPIQLLTPSDRKHEQFSDYSDLDVIVLPFTRSFAQIPYETFVGDMLVKQLQMREMVVGYDHAVGKNREGKWPQLLQLSETLSFGIRKVEPFFYQEEAVSSSAIRSLLSIGDVQKAAVFLQRPYQLNGTVVEGKKRGRGLKFPTANIKPDYDSSVIPAIGVYAVMVKIAEAYHPGMLNIGYRPTFNNGKEITIEVHIFDFNENLYGQNVTIVFIQRIRPEEKFESADALVQQLQKDQKDSKEMLKNWRQNVYYQG